MSNVNPVDSYSEGSTRPTVDPVWLKVYQIMLFI
jgi:hypothetical protein